jgi:hypothetical protein
MTELLLNFGVLARGSMNGKCVLVACASRAASIRSHLNLVGSLWLVEVRMRVTCFTRQSSINVLMGRMPYLVLAVC